MSSNALTTTNRTTVTVRYFAAASEAAGVEQEQLKLGDATLDGLRTALVGLYGEPMAKTLRAGSFLVDGRVRRDGGAILDHAGGPRANEPVIDVLPPFAGG